MSGATSRGELDTEMFDRLKAAGFVLTEDESGARVLDVAELREGSGDE